MSAAGSLAASASVPVLGAPEAEASLVTELVPGETLEVVERRGGWIRVVVPSHRSRLDPRGYPGWVAADAPLLPAGEWSPGLVLAEPGHDRLPLGSFLQAAGEKREKAVLPGGTRATVDEGATIPVGERARRTEIELSTSLLGLPYRWGGTDSTTGMDCSGMVYRVMQLRGVSVPRDADDQFDYAPFSSREHWESAREGDLVFFGEESITHVGFYLDGGSYISEHGSGGTMVRAMNDDPYRGFARYVG
ncbi:MAG: C40 family peptidase [Rubrobacter sp.]|nr:C40 family peptidase [Rubrobacter sp.]